MPAIASVLPQTPSIQAFIMRLSRSRFFTISIALHFIFVLTFGSVVLVRQAAPRSDFEDPGGELVSAAPPPPQAQVQPMSAPTSATAPANPSTSTANPLSVLTVPTNTSSPFSLPAAPMSAPSIGTTLSADSGPSNGAPSAPSFSGIPMQQAKNMKAFTNWRAANDSGQGVGKDRAFKFTAYLAKYAGGDWNSTVQVRDGKIVKGSLPNLLFLLKKWSRNKIDATPDAIPLDLASDQIFAVRPPFIIFTGHRDFVLTDKEVENLSKYLQLGGAVWGDSSLPGAHSRFDLAFRREMKRVLPDQNIAWESLPPDHKLYTVAYYPEIHAVPTGINYYQEPVYALKLYGEISVLYTANDYGDMWQIGLTEKGEIDTSTDEHGNPLVLNKGMYDNREVYFRNLDVKPLNDSYKFGTNIILHLLTRWEDKLRNVPTGL